MRIRSPISETRSPTWNVVGWFLALFAGVLALVMSGCSTPARPSTAAVRSAVLDARSSTVDTKTHVAAGRAHVDRAITATAATRQHIAAAQILVDQLPTTPQRGDMEKARLKLELRQADAAAIETARQLAAAVLDLEQARVSNEATAAKLVTSEKATQSLQGDIDRQTAHVTQLEEIARKYYRNKRITSALAGLGAAYLAFTLLSLLPFPYRLAATAVGAISGFGLLWLMT